MKKFELLSIRCEMCGWQWEISPEANTDFLKCELCGSDELVVEKKILHMLKDGGKFLTDVGYAVSEDTFASIDEDDILKAFQKPLLVVKEDDIRFLDEMTNDERLELLGKMDSIKSKILHDMKDSDDDSLKKID